MVICTEKYVLNVGIFYPDIRIWIIIRFGKATSTNTYSNAEIGSTKFALIYKMKMKTIKKLSKTGLYIGIKNEGVIGIEYRSQV